ncbi:MAG: NUDIX hydrolase, partial [Anaerolineae bacterium]|nr:NUDIX hydrolase [Anaerolineae bacterium]
KIDRAVVRYERFDGTMSPPLVRFVFERGDSVAVLPFDRKRHRVVLVQQFRYPAYVRGGPGWLWEIVAGMWEEGRAPEDVVRSEALEEAGYRLRALHHIMTVYPSPGGSSERVCVYLAPVECQDRVARGGGLPEDGEDILVQEFSLEEALEMIESGQIVDAKTILALQYLAAHWGEF